MPRSVTRRGRLQHTSTERNATGDLAWVSESYEISGEGFRNRPTRAHARMGLPHTDVNPPSPAPQNPRFVVFTSFGKAEGRALA